MTSLVPDVTALLRAGLLSARPVVVCGEPVGGPLSRTCAALDADVSALAVDLTTPESAVARAEEIGAAFAVVVDAGRLLADASAAVEGADALRAALDATWVAVHAVARAALIPARAGVVVLVGPGEGAHAHAGPLRAGLENLARVLGTEWSQHGVRATAVLRGPQTPEEDVAALVAYLVSPGGDYVSGATFTLDAAA